MSINFFEINRENSLERVIHLISRLKEDKSLEDLQYKELLENTHYLLSNNDDEKSYNLSLSAICHVAEYCPSNNLIHQLLFDCIVASRVYPYEYMLSESMPGIIENISKSIYDTIGEEYYTLDNTILTRDQKRLFEIFMDHKRIVVSAPTSFGKSKIIDDILKHNNYTNVFVILPTIALLNENFLRLKRNNYFQDYQIYNSISNVNTLENKAKKIFVLTPEKTDLLLDRFPKLEVDFFAFDEIYKIQDDNERKQVFNNVLYRLTKKKPDFYLIGPYFKSFSKNFLNKTDAKFIHFEAEIVQKDTYDFSDLSKGDKYQVYSNELTYLKTKKLNLRNIVRTVEGQSLVYVKRKDSVEHRAKFLAENSEVSTGSDLIEYIEENISSRWSLAQCLKSGVSFHHGDLPKYIQTEIVDSFNKGEIDTIVCTTTLIEGVNTTAKNVIINDNLKGDVPLTGFDIKNMKGRAGRFLEHFIGNIYTLVNLVEEKEKENIECDYFDNDNLDPESVLQIDDEDLTESNLNVKESTKEYLNDLGIDISIIKENKYLPIYKQISLIEYLRSDFFFFQDLEFDSPLPSAKQLEMILELCFIHLFNKREQEDWTFPLGNLKRLTKFYVYNTPSLRQLIATQNSKTIDAKVRNTFKLISHYFEYYLPRVLTAFQNLFNYSAKSSNSDVRINLNYLITKLEFGFTREHEVIMKEAGVPNDIISKVSDKFADCNSLLQIRSKHFMNPNLLSDLTSFEKRMFERYI